ncbi:hypothetical protein NC651_000042 [Populus alba x Populus x berolinensis]|nr:hypothetical protein NC651_000042 [Populus alba x Populus x berolinensis]
MTPSSWYAEWTELHHPLLSLLAGSDEKTILLLPLFSAAENPGSVVISDMLRRNVRDRPGMRGVGCFDGDRTWPEAGKPVKFIRVPVWGGTMSVFRAIPRKPSSKPRSAYIYGCMSEKEKSSALHLITAFLLWGGMAILPFLSYKAIVLDAKESTSQFTYHCGSFHCAQKTRAHEWLSTSEEGHWLVVESSKAARLIMVMDSKNEKLCKSGRTSGRQSCGDVSAYKRKGDFITENSFGFSKEKV